MNWKRENKLLNAILCMILDKDQDVLKEFCTNNLGSGSSFLERSGGWYWLPEPTDGALVVGNVLLVLALELRHEVVHHPAHQQTLDFLGA